jgi:hypothetical protein
MSQTRSILFVLATAVIASSFVACPLLKKKSTEDETPPVVDAATVSVSGTGAKNEAAVLRYANETPLDNEPAVIAKDGTVVRNFPGNGPEVATLSKGTAVAKIASYFSSGTLIMFDDPAGDGSKLMGWVSPKAFDVAAPPPTKTVFVPPRVVVVVDAGGGGGTVRDAGGGPVDAGGGGPRVVVDAGAPAAPKGVATAPINGACPWAGWMLTEGMCRRKCNADTECPRGTKCAKKGAGKVCTSDN